MSKIICIDPGHGGVDVGAVRGGRYEKSDNLRMAKAVKALLEAQGIKVVLTRDGDSNPALSTRCSTANKANADYFLSIHRNSFGNQNATGAEIWVHHAAQQSTVDKAQRILDEVISVCGKDRGVKKGYTGNPNADYAINRESNMASALLELLFISSDYDNGLYDRYFDKLAVAIAKGLCAAVGVTYGDKKPDAPVGGTYIVKSGDSFWKIAAEQLGDGNRYKELAAFNGMTENSVLHPGDSLKLPNKTENIPVKPSNFFPPKGYFSIGDIHENIAKIAAFMRRVFPSYTDKRALGNLYGKHIQKSVREFQKRTGLNADGNVGPLTLAELKKYGFKE